MKYKIKVEVDDNIVRQIILDTIQMIVSFENHEIAKYEPIDGGVRRCDLDTELLAELVFNWIENDNS